MSQTVLHRPELIHPTAFIAPNAIVVGEVTVGEEASVWFGVVIRGDTEAVVIGPQTNVQDGCILHADPGEPCVVGTRVSLGHGAIVHAATIEDEALIGIRATVLNGARVGRGSLVAAGALIPPGMVIPPQSLVMGVPGKVIRAVNAEDRTRIQQTADHYVAYAQVYAEAYGHSPKPIFGSA